MGHPLTDDLGFLLSRASGVVVRATNTALAEHGLRVRQYSVLVLACDEGGRTQRELASVLGLDPSQVVLLVDELERGGWVERRPDPADRRTRLVVATPAGRVVRDAAARAAEAAMGTLLVDVGAAERAQLHDLLARLIGHEDLPHRGSPVPGPG